MNNPPLRLPLLEEPIEKDEATKVIDKQIAEALIASALAASQAGDDRKAINFLQLAMKAMR